MDTNNLEGIGASALKNCLVKGWQTTYAKEKLRAILE